MIRELMLAPTPILSIKCTPVAHFDGALAVLALDMLETLYHAKGRGLAAPQVGINTRLFVTDVGWKDQTPQPRVFVNPVILEAATETDVHEEQCLSIPDTPIAVRRPIWVVLRWQDLSGAEHKARFDGVMGRCLQHELDHLEGVLITDKAAA